MEFHFPYYALRRSAAPLTDPRGLRRCAMFAADTLLSQENEYLYEAQISLLVTGIDEWFWTAYCCVETYFGSEETIYHYQDEHLDAPSGGERRARYPVWNPREYFLFIASRRFRQVTREWSVIVKALEARLRPQVRTTFKS